MQVASGVQFCSVFFYPHNTGEYGLEIHFTNSSKELYTIVVPESDFYTPNKIDSNVVSYLSYLSASITEYATGQVLWVRDGETILEWQTDGDSNTSYAFSGNYLIEEGHLFFIDSVLYVENGALCNQTNVVDIGEVSPDDM